MPTYLYQMSSFRLVYVDVEEFQKTEVSNRVRGGLTSVVAYQRGTNHDHRVPRQNHIVESRLISDKPKSIDQVYNGSSNGDFALRRPT
jgi:hypothetical protein